MPFYLSLFHYILVNQDNLPTLETCLTNAEGPNLELRRSESTGPTTECKYQSDFYGNFVPVAFNIEVLAFFRVDTSGFPGAPYYIHSYGFGITDAFVLMKKLHVSGKTIPSQHNVGQPSARQQNAIQKAFRWRANGGPLFLFHSRSHINLAYPDNESILG